ncbi:MAG: GNAT family N-acetyltransferase [Planctomycetota bacterium]
MDEKPTADPDNIREMNLETDLEQVKKIWLKWVEKTAPPLKSGESWKSKLSNLESEAQDSRNQKYVYQEDGTIKGFIIAGVLNGSPYLYELYVDCQRKGIGIMLLDRIRKIYRYLNSHVYKCNPYLEFYLKHGFEVCGEQPCPDTGEIKLRIRW